MRCTSCGTELLAGKKFCHVCGTRAALNCPGCGATVDPTFRFCPDCGRALGDEVHDATPPPVEDPLRRLSRQMPSGLAHKIRAVQGVIEGERKQATVLFCDLVGSTAIAERLDPEEYGDLLDRYLELAFAAIYRHEGIVNRLAGDGIMAIFGAPVAHEDAPHRAVHAALEIQEALAGFNDTAVHRGLALHARIGIHTGPVVVGTVGNDLKMDYTAIGDTTNLASRLESLAAPGAILVSEATQRLVRGFFELRPAGPLDVRGKSEPVVAFEVLGLAEAPTPMGIAAERGLTPLVDREEELAQLGACFRRIGGGGAQVVAVVGEAGSGKSRLLYEFKQRLALEDVTVLEGRCSSLSQPVPYAPFVTMFRPYFGILAGDAPAAACDKITGRLGEWAAQHERVVPLLCRVLTAGKMEVDPDDEPSDDVKRESFDAVVRLLLAESERAPVVVVIEDLHWIDDPSRDLLETLAARLATARVMIVTTQRPEDVAPFRSQAAFTQLVLHRLSDADVTAIVRAVAGGPLPAGLEQLLIGKAEGSPFFAEEMVRGLAEEGHLILEEGGPRLTRPVDEVRIPGTVQEVIAARLDRLVPAAKRVVQVAAVLGRQFERARLARLLDGEGIDVARELAELERRGLVHRKHLFEGDVYRFGESLTQEVAYEGLLLKQRRQLHERVGRLLEEVPGDGSAEQSALLAHHYARSDDRRKAIGALLAAARDAERLPSYRAAVDFYRQAWALAELALDEGADDLALRQAAVEAAVKLGSLTVAFGLYTVHDAERAAARGRVLAQGLDDTAGFANLTFMQGTLMMIGDRDQFARGLALSEEAVSVAERAGLEMDAIRMSRPLSLNYVLDGRFELARHKMAWVMRELEARGHRGQLTDMYLAARYLQGYVLYLSDDLDEAVASATETHALALEANNRTIRSGSAGTLAQVSFLRGAYAEAARWADLSLEIAEAIGNFSAIPATAAVALAARIGLDEPVDAARYLDAIERGLASAGNSHLNTRFVGEGFLAAGDLARAERFADQIRTRAGGRLREALTAALVGDVMARVGRLDDAERAYAKGIRLSEVIGARSALAASLVGAAELAALRGDRAVSLRQLGPALDLCRGLRLGRYEPRAERVLAELEPETAGVRS